MSSTTNNLVTNKRKFLSIAVVVLLAILVFITLRASQQRQELRSKAAADTAVLSFSPTTQNILPNGQFTLSVILNSGTQNIVGADILVQFDRTKLTLISIAKSTQNNATFKTYAPVTSTGAFDTAKVVTNANTSGIAEFGIISYDYATSALTQPFIGVFSPVATLVFQAKAGTSGATTIQYKFDGLSGTTDSNVVLNPGSSGTTTPEDILQAPTSTVAVTIAGPSPTPGPSVSPSPSLIPSPSPSTSPLPSGGSGIIDFNNATQGNLNGQYPTGVANWGTNIWFVSGPWGAFTTNSISYNTESIVTGNFTFMAPQVMTSIDAYNGGTGASTITLSCTGNPTVTTSVGATVLRTITTNWTVPCTTVTIGSSNGSFTNFDNIAYTGGTLPSSLPSASPTACQNANINQDAIVDLRDYAILVNDWFANPPANPRSDINKDNTVDLRDYAILVQNWFQSCP